MIAVALILGLVVGVVIFRFYRDLANIRRQLVAARGQIDAQIAVRNKLRAELQAELQSRTGTGGPAIVGVDAHARLEELRTAERKIEFATDYHNQVAKNYKDRLRVFPYSFIAFSFRLPKEKPLDMAFEQEIVAGP
jgi:hypothetical protein